MANTIELKVQKREKAGKGSSRAIRRTGFIPAVIYGDKKEPVLFSMEEKVMVSLLNKPGLWTHQFEIDVDGTKYHALCQDVQYHPVSDRPIHADFLRINQNEKIKIEVPVHYLDEDVNMAIKSGMTLNIVHRSVEILTTADNIPDNLEVSVAELTKDGAITTADLKLPAGVSLTHEDEITLATLTAPVDEGATESSETSTSDEAKKE